MLNPALLALLIGAAAEEYTRKSSASFPYAYSFLVAPLVLHRDTREALPNTVASHLANWVLNHPVIAAGFPERARSLAPLVSEGIRFGIRTETLTLLPGGDLWGQISATARPPRIGDVANIVAKAGFVGRWLVKIDRPATAFVLLGVKP